MTQIVELTEENDPNNLIGRPNGYVAAAVLFDSRVNCESPGVRCGATIEQWPDQAAAQNRADYIQSHLKSASMLLKEWTTVKGQLLLRVSGGLTPSAAKDYETAFNNT